MKTGMKREDIVGGEKQGIGDVVQIGNKENMVSLTNILMVSKLQDSIITNNAYKNMKLNNFIDKAVRYGDNRRSNADQSGQGKWRSRKHEDRCYPREPQESPWEDEYSNDPEHLYYTGGKRTSKSRPSSASEIDRKTGEIKLKHYLQTGNSKK